MEEMYVYLHDVLTNKWVKYTPGEWIDQFDDRLGRALVRHAATFGGTLTFTGTPEYGHITIYDAGTHEVLLDEAWHTLSMSEANQSKPAQT